MQRGWSAASSKERSSAAPAFLIQGAHGRDGCRLDRQVLSEVSMAVSKTAAFNLRGRAYAADSRDHVLQARQSGADGRKISGDVANQRARGPWQNARHDRLRRRTVLDDRVRVRG